MKEKPFDLACLGDREAAILLAIGLAAGPLLTIGAVNAAGPLLFGLLPELQKQLLLC